MKTLNMALLMICCYFFSSSSYANDVLNVTYTGSIVATTCKVAAGSSNQAITFPDVITTNGLTAGVLATQNFQIPIVDCPPSQSSISIKFTGMPDTVNPSRAYANSGSAKNVAIEIVTSYNIEMGNGKSSTIYFASDKAFNFKANLVSRGNMTAGTIQTVVTAELSYP
ncbi:fimbrial protein [Enterobacter hormaechei]